MSEGMGGGTYPNRKWPSSERGSNTSRCVSRTPRSEDDLDYISRTIATVRNHRDADNCWPQWANIFADEIERLWDENARLAVEVATVDRDWKELLGVLQEAAESGESEQIRSWCRLALFSLSGGAESVPREASVTHGQAETGREPA